jgi:hypothetical protein
VNKKSISVKENCSSKVVFISPGKKRMDPGSSNQDEVGDYDEIDTWFGPMMNEEQQYVMDMEAINSSYSLMPLLQGKNI